MVRTLASHQRGPGWIAGLGIIIMWVEFVVGSCPCSKRFFSGYFGFPLFNVNIIFSICNSGLFCDIFFSRPVAPWEMQ